MKLRSAIGAFALAAATFVGGAATLHAQEMWYYGDNLSDESGQIVLEDPSNPGSFIIASAREGANYVFRINASGAVTQARRFQVTSGITYKETITDLRVDATGSFLIGVGAVETIDPRPFPLGMVLSSAGEPRGGYVFKMQLSDLLVVWSSEIVLDTALDDCVGSSPVTFEPVAILDASSTDGRYYIYGTKHVSKELECGTPALDAYADTQYWSAMWVNDHNGTVPSGTDFIRGMRPESTSLLDGYRNRCEAAVLGHNDKVLAVGNRDYYYSFPSQIQKAGAIVSYPHGSIYTTPASSKTLFTTTANYSANTYTTRDIITLCNSNLTCYGVSVGGNVSNGKFTLAVHIASSNTGSGSNNNAIHQGWEFQMGGGWSTEAYEVVLDGMDASSVRLVVMGTAKSGSNTDIFLAKIRLNISGATFTPSIDWAKRYGQSTVQEGFKLNPQSQLIKTASGNFIFVAQSDNTPGSTEKDIMLVKADASGNAGSTCEASATFTYVANNASQHNTPMQDNVEKPTIATGPSGGKTAGPGGARLCFSGRMAPQGLELGHTSSLYPNPATSSATLAYTQAAPGAEAQLMDIRGGVVRSYPLSADEGALDMSLDGLPQGIYLVSYPTAEGGRQTLKLVIQ